MSYPGNPSSPPDVRQRTTATFRQALELVAQGKEQEALAGCEFILGLDSAFEPARQLRKRLQSPDRPVTIDDLHLAAAPPVPGQQAVPATAEAGAPGAGEEPPSAQPPGGLGVVLFDLLAKKNYRQILQIAESQAQAIEKNPELQSLVASARTALAAEAPAAAGPQPPAPAAQGALPPETGAAPPVVPPSAPAPSAAAPVEASMEDDLLALQQQSLSLDSEHYDPLSEIGSGEVDLESLDDLEPPGDPDSLDNLDSLDDLDSLELDEDALPELDESMAEPPPDIEVPAPADEPAPLGEAAVEEAPLSFDDEPVAFGDEVPSFEVEAAGALAAGAPAAGAPAAEPPAAEPPAAEPPGPELPLGAAGEEDGQERIAELLEEGQAVFDGGDFQGAIDVWSRIFLIDITNGEASRRIEEARKKKAELERQAEEIFHEGVDHVEQEALEEAKAAFRRVLEIDPKHSLAEDYLEQLEAGKVPAVIGRQEAAEIEDLAAAAAGEAVEASPSLEAAVERDRVVVVKKTDKRLLALAALAAVVIVGGGAWLFLNKDKLFRNTTQAPAPAPRRIDPIARATALHEQGNAEQALEVLRALPEDDPSHKEAIALIDQWEALRAAEEEVDAGPSPELLERRDLLLTAAHQAHQERRYIRARKYFERAHKILPLESQDMALKLNCDAELQSLSNEIEQFGEREYAEILPDLWRKRDKDPDNQDVNQLIVDSYYNLALVDLQRGNAVGAVEKLGDALDVDPDNRDLQRLHLFAQTYSERSSDLLYLIFVKYLPSHDL